MKLIIMVLAGLFLFTGCSVRRIDSEFSFGNKLAGRGLWREAHGRWRKVLEKNNKGAGVHNNIAVALECQDKLKEAEREYVKALNLAPGNEYISRNLSRLRRRINPGVAGVSKSIKNSAGKKVKKGKGEKK